MILVCACKSTFGVTEELAHQQLRVVIVIGTVKAFEGGIIFQEALIERIFIGFFGKKCLPSAGLSEQEHVQA